MRTLYQTVTAKQELSWKAKLSIYHSISVPALSYACVLWAVTEKIRLSVEVAQSSDRDVSWALCIWGVFLDPCNWWETSSLTRNTRERLCISSGLWLLPDPPGRARKPCCGQRYQSYLATATWPQKVIEMDTLEKTPTTTKTDNSAL